MRNFFALALHFLPLLCLPIPALAGNQVEERLSDSARSSLQASIADRAVPVLSFDTGSDNAHKWIFEMSARLQRRIPDRKTRTELLKTVHHEARRNGLDPQLVLGVMEIESGFRKYAVSSSGARGYMQVMPFWIRVIGESPQPVFAAHQPALRLRHPAPLPERRERGLFPRARPL